MYFSLFLFNRFFLWIIYACTVFKPCSEKSNFEKKLLKLIKKIEISSKECVTRACFINFD